MSECEYRKEMERLGIDLSWKSSQIEGNTYSLLETERLFRESQVADGKTKDEAVMLLNHKKALRFVLDNPDYLHQLSVSHIEDIHQLLTEGLSVDRGIRHRRVGITGTNYRPLDNEFQIREAMYDTCNLINGKECVFGSTSHACATFLYEQNNLHAFKQIFIDQFIIAKTKCAKSENETSKTSLFFASFFLLASGFVKCKLNAD